MRARRVIAAVAGACLTAAGCTGSDDGRVDLADDGATAAPSEEATDPPVEVTDEPADPAEDEQLYPPLPPLEPDPDSDIPIGDQQFFLELHQQAYAAIEQALATNALDEDRLGEILVPAELEALEASIAKRVEAGTELRSPDSKVLWVRVTDARGGEGVVQDCRIRGPRTGSYDERTGEQVGEGRSRARIVEFLFSPVEVGGDVAYRVAGMRTGEDPERCSA